MPRNVKAHQILGILSVLAAGCGSRTGVQDQVQTDSLSDSGIEQVADSSPGTATAGIVIATIDRPCNVTVHGARLYWSTSLHHEVWGCDLGDCEGSKIRYAEEQGRWPVLAADDSRVYWGAAGVGSCLASECTSTEQVNCVGMPTRIAVDESRLFWTSGDTSGNDGILDACNKSGCTCSDTPLDRELGPGGAGGLAVDGDSIYWVRTGAAGQVMQLAKSGGEPVELAGLQNQPDDLFVDDTFVYWTTRWAGGSLFRCLKAGCAGAPETVLANQQNAGTILGDATSLYWIASPVPTPYDGTAPEELHTCSKSDCAHTHRLVATMNASSECRQRIAQDDLYVYWTENPDLKPRDKGSGRIKRIRK